MTCIRNYGTLATSNSNNNTDSALSPSDLVPFISRQITCYTECPACPGSCFSGVLTDVYPDSIKLCNYTSPGSVSPTGCPRTGQNVSPLTNVVLIAIDKITCVKYPSL